MTYNLSSIFRNALEVYEYLCRPVCKNANIQQGELDVLLFLANHPDMNKAVDIHRCAGIKQSMLSTLVEKLVQGGYLERQPTPDDRRKVKLVCTKKASPIIKEGQSVQKKFLQYILAGADKEDINASTRVKNIVEQNILTCKKQIVKGELS